MLSPRQILDRLSQRLDLLKGGRDADPRQQTLRATIEWSYELLQPEEQRLFARLSVFRGGCTLEAAEEVAEADLDTLQSLVDKSLVRKRDERYWMLETIREYGTERLEASGAGGELRRRHAEHFAALAEEAQPHVRTGRNDWLERLEEEHANFRVALDELAASRETQLALRVAGALSRFWFLRGHLEEGRRRLESALANDKRRTAPRAKALNGAAVMAVECGDPATERLRAEEAIAIHGTIGDELGAADSTFMLAHALSELGDLSGAQQLFEESVRRFRELGDARFVLIATHNLAWMCHCRGDRERARELYEQNLRRAREGSDERVEAVSMQLLAEIAVEEGRIEDALAMLAQSHRINRELGDRRGIAYDLDYLAAALARDGRAAEAARLLSRSDALRAEIGTRSADGRATQRAGVCRDPRAARRRYVREGVGGGPRAHGRRGRRPRPRVLDSRAAVLLFDGDHGRHAFDAHATAAGGPRQGGTRSQMSVQILPPLLRRPQKRPFIGLWGNRGRRPLAQLCLPTAPPRLTLRPQLARSDGLLHRNRGGRPWKGCTLALALRSRVLDDARFAEQDKAAVAIHVVGKTTELARAVTTAGSHAHHVDLGAVADAAGLPGGLLAPEQTLERYARVLREGRGVIVRAAHDLIMTARVDCVLPLGNGALPS